MQNYEQLHIESLELLKKLIAVPSFSREEGQSAQVLEEFFKRHAIPTNRSGNNIWAKNHYYNDSKPTLLLHSHHDTVKPNPGYTVDPFLPTLEDGKLFGLGSNDAGGSLVSLIAAFAYFSNQQGLKYNLVMAATAEEEISGTNGMESIWSQLPPIACAIVGEPTLLEVAVSEKGLLVIDCLSTGKAGHAAREEGDNAIYIALRDIEWFRTYQFPKQSPTLGKVKMTPTVIQAGLAHNQIPSECRFTVDIRVTDAYTLEEVLETVKKNIISTIVPRSVRLKPSSIPMDHPLVLAAVKLGKKTYGSPTTSDRALIPVPAIKMGPGDSARSHMADEYIFVREIEEGIRDYVGVIGLL